MTTFHINFLNIARVGVLAICFTLFIAACGSVSTAYYGFEFDVRKDGQDALILDYKYLADDKVQVAGDPYYANEGGGFAQEAVFAHMLRGTSLYVKWQNKESGHIYEDTVDLRSQLRREDMDGKIIYLMIKGSQLYVYLISNERRLPQQPPIGPSALSYRSTKLIYPVNQ